MSNEIEQRLRAARRRYESAVEHRNEEIRDAHRRGLSFRQIGAVFGKSHSWARDIVSSKKRD